MAEATLSPIQPTVTGTDYSESKIAGVADIFFNRTDSLGNKARVLIENADVAAIEASFVRSGVHANGEDMDDLVATIGADGSGSEFKAFSGFESPEFVEDPVHLTLDNVTDVKVFVVY